MNYIEYGKRNSKVIILLHGGGLSWWNYKEVAEILQTDYHVILPVLDGHAGSDKQFTTIEDNACEIIEFIKSQFAGSVLLLGGLSLGGQILLEVLSRVFFKGKPHRLCGKCSYICRGKRKSSNEKICYNDSKKIEGQFSASSSECVSWRVFN